MVRVGIAGWDYPDWEGVVYPAAERRLDRLAFVSRFVDAIEINSTFYHPVDPRTAASWLRRTGERDGFRFTAKAHRSWTHERDTAPAQAVPATLLGLAPLRDAGALGAVLVQFPQSFHRTPESHQRLEALAEHTAGWPVVVELRHVSWDDDDAALWCRERGLGWCVVDQPRMGGSTVPARARVTSPVGYVRLHGRNWSDWFRADAGRDARYDYLYEPQELAPLVEAARGMARQAEDLYVIQNNHFRGKALVNALHVKHLLDGERPPAPEPLVRAYPQIEPFVTVTGAGQARLF